MSWAEIKKAINSNISKSLDVLITEKCNELQSKLNSVYNTVTVTGNIPAVKSVQRGLSQMYNENMGIHSKYDQFIEKEIEYRKEHNIHIEDGNYNKEDGVNNIIKI